MALALELLGAFAQYQGDKAKAKAEKALQAYRNTMVNISNGQNQNAITDNELISNAAYADQAMGIKQSNIITTAQSEVQAAAAGVKGRSVNQVMGDLNRNAAVAERQRQISLTNANLAFDHQRQSSAQAAANQQDYSFIPKPNLGTYLLNAVSQSSINAVGSAMGFGG